MPKKIEKTALPSKYPRAQLEEVLRRAAWDAVHGPIHLRRGHFYQTRAEFEAAMAKIEKPRH